MVSKDDLVTYLRQRGERLTIQRQAVIEALAEARQHVTVQAIQQQVQAKGIALNEPTVYRILQWLNDLGLVSQTDLGQGGCVYEVIAEHPHHHLICLQCGSVIDIDDQAMESLRRYLRATYQFEPRIDHMAIFGICQGCQGHAPE